MTSRSPGLRQGGALCPLLLILVMNLVSRKIITTLNRCSEEDYVRRRSLQLEHLEELQGALEEWNEMFKKHDLKMNLYKTEVM